MFRRSPSSARRRGLLAFLGGRTMTAALTASFIATGSLALPASPKASPCKECDCGAIDGTDPAE